MHQLTTSSPFPAFCTSFFKNGSLVQMCGIQCREAQVAAYDGVNEGWDNHDFNSPGCYVARKARDIPGINIAVVGHSMGGIAAVHMIKDVATGFSAGWGENDAPNRAPAYRPELEPGTGRRRPALLAN
jgi:hypothetical protein